jgi:DNA-binding winged helix-turn-helix (wHTH) protein
MSGVDRLLASVADQQARIDEQREQAERLQERLLRLANAWHDACRFDLPDCQGEEQIAHGRALRMQELAKELIQEGYRTWLTSRRDEAEAELKSFDLTRYYSIDGQKYGLSEIAARAAVATLLVEATTGNVIDVAAGVRKLGDEATRHYLSRLRAEWGREVAPKSSAVSAPNSAVGTNRIPDTLPDTPQSPETVTPSGEPVRSASGGEGPLGIELDTREWQARRGGVVANFAGREFPWKIFQHLCRQYPAPVPTGQMLTAAWGPGEGTDTTLRVHITTVRGIISPLNLTIKSTRKVGYRLVEKPPEQPPRRAAKPRR